MIMRMIASDKMVVAKHMGLVFPLNIFLFFIFCDELVCVVGRDEHGTGTGTVSIPYRIIGTDFFPSIN